MLKSGELNLETYTTAEDKKTRRSRKKAKKEKVSGNVNLNLISMFGVGVVFLCSTLR